MSGAEVSDLEWAAQCNEVSCIDHCASCTRPKGHPGWHCDKDQGHAWLDEDEPLTDERAAAIEALP